MPYFITHTGKKIDIESISEDDICITDIAHHLTKICRFGGALDFDKHYSVAQHSIQLVQYALVFGYNEGVLRALLMHDATEAYLGDIVTGLKCHLKDYKRIEKNLERIIFNKYKITITPNISKIVDDLDKRIVLDEVLKFMPHNYQAFKLQMPDYEPLGTYIENYPNCDFTYAKFIILAHELNIVG